MDFRTPSPLPESLPIKPEYDASTAEESDQTHVGHDGRDISRFNDPRRNELRKSISPDILIHRDGNKDRSSDRFV